MSKTEALPRDVMEIIILVSIELLKLNKKFVRVESNRKTSLSNTSWEIFRKTDNETRLIKTTAKI